MKCKKVISIILAVILSVVTNGCWSYSEVDDRLIVGSVGIDYCKNKSMYRVTIRVVNPKPTSGGIELIPNIITLEGKSIFEAIRKSDPVYARKTYWSHLQSIIISDEVAQEDILETLDFFYRDSEVRQDNRLYIASGSSAEDVVKLEASLQVERQFTLRYAMRTQKFIGSFPELDLVDFGARSLSDTIEPIVPIVKIYKDYDRDLIKTEGSAVFSKNKMVGKLSPSETLAALLITNDAKNPLLVVPISNKDNVENSKIITLEVFKSKTKIKYLNRGNDVGISVNIQINVGIAEINYPMNNLSEKSIYELENILNDNLEQYILKTIKTVQTNYKSDIFGFGKRVETANPKLWDNIKNQWSEKFSEMPVYVNVTLKVKSTGKLSKST